MKLTIQYHAGNPNICRIPELTIRQLPECEGGGWWLPREQAEAIAKPELTEEMETAGFTAMDEYKQMVADRVFPRPSLIAYVFNSIMQAAKARGK